MVLLACEDFFFLFLVTVVVVLMLAFLGLRWFNLLVFFSGGKGVVCL